MAGNSWRAIRAVYAREPGRPEHDGITRTRGKPGPAFTFPSRSPIH